MHATLGKDCLDLICICTKMTKQKKETPEMSAALWHWQLESGTVVKYCQVVILSVLREIENLL